MTTTEIAKIDAEWEVLLGRVLSSMDDNDAERLERCRVVAKKKLKRMGLTEPQIDVTAVKRFLLLYSKLEKRHNACLREIGISKADLIMAYNLWPESKFVRDAISKMRDEARMMDNEDRVADALESLDRLNSEDDCKLNAKAVMFTLENLDSGNFGMSSGGRGGRKDGRSQVTYVIPNLTVNNIMAPDEVAERLKAQARRTAMAHGMVVEAEGVLT